MGKTENQRFILDLGSLRQDICTHGSEEVWMLHILILCGKIRWTETRVMAVDCLTKNMPTYLLVKILRASSYDVTPDPESTLKKVKKQLARARVNVIPLG
eukprot:3746791-Pyramimonas_sp.AAC.1